MRFSIGALFLLVAVVSSSVWYQEAGRLCPIPLGYRLGNLSPEFNLSTEEALVAVAEAETIWEESTGRDLFFFNEEGPLVVDFVFDERQAEADSEVARRQQLDEERKTNDRLFAEIEALQKTYEERLERHRAATQRYEDRLQAHNATVQRYNDQGGAPSDIFAELEEEKSSLSREFDTLNATSAELQSLAEEINRLADRGNTLVNAYNKEVDRYNEQFGFSREFTQGDYHDGIISIYKFSDKDELRTVLVHELGHAIGIGHVEDETAVMYYLLGEENKTPVLRQADIEAFTAVCGTGDEMIYTVRRLMREIVGFI